jgi:transcription antitermination factor NusG
MDELFERIKILEDESKVLEKEYNDLNNELQLKKIEESTKKWLSDKEKEENQKKIDSYTEQLNKYKKLIDENMTFPQNQDPYNITLPATLKNPKFDEIEILNFFKLLDEEKKRLTYEKQKNLEKIELQINPKKEEDPKFNSLADEFDKKFKGRIINHKNINYLIKYFDKKDKNIKAMMLYDSNGIKVNEKTHDKLRLYNSIEVKDLFEDTYIISKEESSTIMKDYLNDNKHIIKIYYQMQVDRTYRYEKDLIPYKIEPSYIDINQYNLSIQSNSIKEVENKENRCFVIFDQTLIGDGKSTTGLVSSSSIKVYTTLYSKDILNILHIHLNDTSQEITIDSEFLEKEDSVINHKVFTVDAMGKRLTYKLIFKDYRLIKIFYSVSNDFIDEPPFEEIRITPNNYVKIIKGDYKNFYGQVKEFPIGMLARKDKELGELKRMSSSGFQKEGYCPDRHLEELPGFVSVKILFTGDNPPQQMKEPINISIPVCFLIPLSPEEQIKFEKSVIIQQEMEIEEANQEIDEIFKKCEVYESYIKNDSLLEEKSLEEIKAILNEVEKINIEELGKNASDEFKDKLEFIKGIKEQINPILIQKIRYFTLMNKK